MNARFAPGDLTRLSKICALFGSEHAGERAAAAAKANDIVRAAGLTWDRVLVPSLPRPGYDKTPPETWDPVTWADMVRWCREADCGQLNERDRQFLDSMAVRVRQGGEPSPRQGAWLRDIHARLAGGRGRC